MKYWNRKEKLFKYVDGVRQFFPLAIEQLDIISRIIEKYNPGIKTFLDLGCGDGFLGYYIYNLYPDSHGVFLDISNEMIEKAQKKDNNHKSEFIVKDFGDSDWYKAITTSERFDLVISGYSIHHIENEKKKRLYKDIYNLLNTNGIFLNLEHVSSASPLGEELFSELFLNGMSDYQDNIGEPKTREELEKIYKDPDHKALNKLESVTEQCTWLNEIGFTNVDCFLKIYELAIFGGIKEYLI